MPDFKVPPHVKLGPVIDGIFPVGIHWQESDGTEYGTALASVSGSDPQDMPVEFWISVADAALAVYAEHTGKPTPDA